MANRPSYIPPEFRSSTGAWSPGDWMVGSDVYKNTTPAAPGAPPVTGGNMPGPLLDKTAANLTSAANGELPPDVIEQLRRHAAEFGLGAGLPGSEFAGYQGLKQLGLTSLARQDMATQATLPFFDTPALRQNRNQFNTNLALHNRAIQDADTARQIAQQKQYADQWNAGRSDPWARGGAATVGGGGGSAINYGGNPNAGRTSGAPPPANYNDDIGSFISKYLPGAGSKGLFNLQPGDTDPVNLNSGVSSTDLAPAGGDGMDWGSDWDPSSWEN